MTADPGPQNKIKGGFSRLYNLCFRICALQVDIFDEFSSNLIYTFLSVIDWTSSSKIIRYYLPLFYVNFIKNKFVVNLKILPLLDRYRIFIRIRFFAEISDWTFVLSRQRTACDLIKFKILFNPPIYQGNWWFFGIK